MLTALLMTVVGSATTADWSDYRPTTMGQAWAQAVVVAGSDYTVEPANVKYSVDAAYTGAHREVGANRAELFRRWAKSLGHPAEYAKLCEHEVSVRANNKTYWLPLQKSLVDAFANDAASGSRVRLRIMYVGAVGDDRVFMVNGFEVLGK